MYSPFPVYDRLVLSGQNVIHPPKFFDLHSIWASYFASPAVNSQKTSYDDFGSIRPPFPNIWAEFTMPTLSGPIETGVAICETGMFDFPEYPEATRALEIIPYALIENRVRRAAASLCVFINEDGKFIGQGLKWKDSWRSKEVEINVRKCADVVLFALGLVNCKNVTTEQRISGGKAGRKSRRARKGTEYHVIRLPGQSSGSGGAGAGTGVALHTVRGHFKTYTEDKPLMGRFTGTYWWAHHARGSVENGRTISSYQVAGK